MNADLINSLNALSSRWAVYVFESLTGGLVALALAAILTFLLRRRVTASLLCILWLLVLVRTAVPFTVGIPVPAALETPRFQPASLHLNADPYQAPAMEEGLVAADVQSSHYRTAPAPRLAWTAGVFLLWAAVAGAGLARLLLISRRTRQLVHSARPATPGELPGDTASLGAALGLRRPIPVRFSAQLSSPAVAGLLRPVLLVPEGLGAQLSPAQWQWAAAHELLHIRRGDLWAGAFAALMKALFFFHPAVWIACRKMDTLREEACDAGAAALVETGPRETAEGFLKMLEWSSSQTRRPALAMLAMSRGHRDARHRLGNLLSGVKCDPRLLAPWALVLLPVAGCLLLVGPGLRPEPVHARGGIESQTANTSTTLLPAATPVAPAAAHSAPVQPTGTRIVELESRVADLEQQLRAKTRLDTLRENAKSLARARVARDTQIFTADQIHEIEVIYQEAKKLPTFTAVAEAMQPLFDRFPGSNRTGCAALYVGRQCEGAAREQWLRYAIERSSDCLFLDGTSVGGLARVLLAEDCFETGSPAEAVRLLGEVRTAYPQGIDFEGTPLIELADRVEASAR